MYYIAAPRHKVLYLTVHNCFHKAGFGNSKPCNIQDSCDVPIGNEKWGKLESHASFDDYVNTDENIVTTEVMSVSETGDGIQQEMENEQRK